LEQWVKDAGFVNVSQRVVKLPLGSWARDPMLKEIGHWNITQLMMGLEGFVMRLFTSVLGWAPEEVQVFLVGLRKELKSLSVHAYCNL